MGIIDCHIHLLRKEWLSDTASKIFTGISNNLSKDLEISSSPASLYRHLKSEGVDRAFVLMSWHDAFPGGTKEGNVYTAEFCRQNKKLIPIAYLEPGYVKDPVELIEELVRDYGIKGLKLHPPSGFYPNDNALYSLYRKALELKIPVFFHTGTSVLPGMRYKYGKPGYLDDVSIDFPELTIVMIHSGRGCDYDEAFLMCRLHKNIIMDITGLPPKKLLSYFPALEANQEKIIFGTDWPTIPSTISGNIAEIRELPLKSKTIEKILRLNAEAMIDKHQMM